MEECNYSTTLESDLIQTEALDSTSLPQDNSAVNINEINVVDDDDNNKHHVMTNSTHKLRWLWKPSSITSSQRFAFSKRLYKQHITQKWIWTLFLLGSSVLLSICIAKTSTGLVVGASGTILTSGIPIYMFYSQNRFKRHINIMLVYKSIADILLAISFLLEPLWQSIDVGSSSSSCKWLSVGREYCIMYSNAWILCLALDFKKMTTNPFSSPSRNRSLYFILTNAVAFISSTFLASSESHYGLTAGHFCWVRVQDPTREHVSKFDRVSFTFVYLPIISIVLINAFVTISTLTRLKTHGLSATLVARKKLLREIFLSNIAFIAYSGVLWLLYTLLWYSSNDTPVIVSLFNFMLAYRGGVAFILWLLHNNLGAKHPDNDDDTAMHPQANVALQRELVYFTTRGLEMAVNSHSNVDVLELDITCPDHLHSISPRFSAPFRKYSSSSNNGTSAVACKFKAYDSELYREIRDTSNLCDNDFLESFKNCSQPSISEGASGAFMFFTQDKKFIIKSLSAVESEVLHDIAFDYKKHVTSSSHLTKFYGSFSLKLYRNTYYFVVMSNIFANARGESLQRYDIKGSWVNRHARKNSDDHNVVYKDNDLKERVTGVAPVAVDKAVGKKIVASVTRDAKFCADHGILDYSMLIGVAQVACENSSITNSNGYRAEFVYGPEEYYIGVVDMLQRWTLKKRLERFFKVYIRRLDPNGVSVMPPDGYYQRFCQKVAQVINN